MAETSHTAGWPLTHAEALALLRSHGASDIMAGAEPIGEGDYCLAFRREDVVLRVAKHPDAAAALQRETCLLAAIAPRLPLPVPQPRLEPIGDICVATVHRIIDGVALEPGEWERLPTQARVANARALGAFLDALHSIPPETAASCGVPTISARDVAARLRPRLHRLDDAAGRPLASRIERALSPAFARAAWAGAPDRLLHRDVAPGHVLYDPATMELTGVIDFGDAALGDPARDFAYVYADFGATILADVLAGYAREPAETLLPRMHLWYLLESAEWTLERVAEGCADDVAHGVDEIARELDALGA